jgi:hypothetical protein
MCHPERSAEFIEASIQDLTVSQHNKILDSDPDGYRDQND